MIKFKITTGNQIIEFASESQALQYKEANNLNEEIQSFEEEIIIPIDIPLAVTPRQMRVALVLSGISVETIENTIEALPEPQKSITKITWEYSTEFHRDNPILNQMAPVLGLSQEDIDNLFILANTL